MGLVRTITSCGSVIDGFPCFRGYAAYERLSPLFARYLETLEAVHEARFFIGVAQRAGIKLRDGA